MKRRGLVVLALALIFASVAVFLARSWVQDQVGLAENANQSAVQLTTVVVAGTRLDFGNTIRREHLRVVDWPMSSVPPNTFSTIEEILDSGDGEGATEGTGSQERVVLMRIEANEPIYRNKVSGFGGRASLSTKIDDEMRALTIRVNDVLGVAGFVLPGDRVDILLTRSTTSNSRSNKKNLINTVLLEEVKVLGIDQEANHDEDKPTVVKAVTLEVTSKQAQKLTLAAQVGTLTLALRGTTTVDSAKGRTIDVSDLYVGESNATTPEPVAVVEPPKPVKPAAHSAPVAAAPPPPKPTPKPDKFTTVNILRGLDPSKTKVLAETVGEQQFGQTTSIPIVPSGMPSASQAPAVGVSPEGIPVPNGSVIDLLRNTPFSGIGEGNPISVPGTIAPAVSPEDPGV